MQKKQLIKFKLASIMNLSFLMFIIPAVFGVLINLLAVKAPQRLTGNVILDLVIALASFVAVLFVHEGLHAVGFMLFGKAKSKDISFGVILRQGMIYCTTKKPLTARAYGISLVLPLIFTAIIPFIISMVLGNVILVLVFSFAISGAAGDVFMLNTVRKYDKNQLILDHPKAPAFYLVYEEGQEPEGFVEVTEEDERIVQEELTVKSKDNMKKSWGLKASYILLFLMGSLGLLFIIAFILVMLV